MARSSFGDTPVASRTWHRYAVEAGVLRVLVWVVTKVETAWTALEAAIALCDHDTVGGIDEALEAGKRLGIRVLTGDKVLVEMTPYDLSKGRITYRFK